MLKEVGIGGERGELKHLSTHRKRENSLSSGERKGRSPNLRSEEACGRCDVGVVGYCGGGPQATTREEELAEWHWEGRPEGVKVP